MIELDQESPSESATVLSFEVDSSSEEQEPEIIGIVSSPVPKRFRRCRKRRGMGISGEFKTAINRCKLV